jgi:hypothetical protein
VPAGTVTSRYAGSAAAAVFVAAVTDASSLGFSAADFAGLSKALPVEPTGFCVSAAAGASADLSHATSAAHKLNANNEFLMGILSYTVELCKGSARVENPG